MSILARISLLLVVILVSLAAYLRLANSGIGCADWPDCYGRLGEVPVATQALADQSLGRQGPYSQRGALANQPMAWATPAHRLVASTLGLLVIAMTIMSVRLKRHRVLCLSLLGLTIFLAVLGIRSGGLHNPAVVMGNLAGGFGLLGLLGWLALGHHRSSVRGSFSVRVWSLAAIIMLVMQIFLGGLTSANFAATACNTVPDCHGSYLPGPALPRAFDLSRQHQVSSLGVVVGGPEQADIHKLHRLAAVVTVLLGLITGLAAIRAGRGMTLLGMAIILLVLTEFSVGVAAILTRLPIGLAVAHNWLAGLLLLSLLGLTALSRKSEYL
ncbi:MAG: COX15/CtaA family protein [Gammaproteobacteria bacterium]|jgi:cytochrome c oxidase assembly protein subunit 15|nr:COX15/CtaA family protein [Gammaproteobacteria bacterium]